MRFPMQRLRSSSWQGGWSILAWSILVLAVLSTGCAGTRHASNQKPVSTVPTTVSAAVTLAEPSGNPELELESLGRVKTTPALLRRAFLELRNGHPRNAIEATAEVLYGPVRPGANEESFARYLRAEAHAMKGTPELGKFDRDRARELALDPELRRLLPAPAEPVADARDESMPAMSIQRRASWNAKAPDRTDMDPMGRPTRLTMHHSAVYFRDTRSTTCAAQIQKIQREHMHNSGWADIGYHFLIDPSGRIWEGREMRWQGAHAEGRNNIGNIGICVLGNFMRGRGGQEPTRAQVVAMRQLVSSLMQRYDFGADQIHCHRDFKATECPGPLLQSLVTQLARDLQRQGTARVADGKP